MPLFSSLPIPIATASFPHEFLVTCCDGEGPGLRIDSPEAVARGIAPLQKIRFTMNYRGDGHWAVSLWLSDERACDGCYLTAEAMARLKHQGGRDWQVQDQSGEGKPMA